MDYSLDILLARTWAVVSFIEPAQGYDEDHLLVIRVIAFVTWGLLCWSIGRNWKEKEE